MKHRKDRRSRRISRRRFLERGLRGSAAVALSCLLPWSGCGVVGGGRRPRNLVLVSIDTLRADRLGCYGHDREVSPALDRFAAEGALFEEALTPSPWTLPAHASLLTGLYPSRHGVKALTHGLPEEVPALAEILGGAGFRTAGYVNSSHLSRRHGLHRGFEDFRYIYRSAGERRPSRVGDLAADWLDGAPEERFFLFVHYYDVHSDYRAERPYEERFVRPYAGVADGTTEQLVAFRRGETPLGPEDARHLLDLYDAEIRQMDDGLARLFEKLEERGLAGETLVAVTSDHGEEFLDHGDVLHGRTHYREVSRVPLLLRGPAVPAGIRVDRPVSLVDLLPTALALLDVDSPAAVDGIDLAAHWREGTGLPDNRLIFGEADHNNEERDIKRLVRRGRHAYHMNRSDGRERLFDVRADPAETVDVSEDHAETVRELREALENFMEGERVSGTGVTLFPEETKRLRSLGYLR